MNAQILHEDIHPPTAVIERLLAEHGALRVLGALLRVLVCRDRHRAHNLDDLSGHVRRDIGLPAEPSSRKYWELR